MWTQWVLESCCIEVWYGSFELPVERNLQAKVHTDCLANRHQLVGAMMFEEGNCNMLVTPLMPDKPGFYFSQLPSINCMTLGVHNLSEPQFPHL